MLPLEVLAAESQTSSQPSRTASLLWIVVCYLLCFAGVWAWLAWGPKTESVMLDSFLADLVAVPCIFAFSRFFRNSSFYDLYWSLAPPFFLGFWYWVRAPQADETRILLLAILVLFWAVRLSLNWLVHWPGLVHEDWRYPMLREKAPKLALLTDFFLVHLFPTGQVFLGMMPIYAALCLEGEPLWGLDYVAFGVGMAAVLLEMVADLQLHRFMRTRMPGQLLDTGLWSYSRHPNYFGELMFWVSLSLFGIAALPSQWWWQILGAIAMLLMFWTASIPMMEKKLSSRPGYQELVQRVSIFVPWPPKKTHQG